MNTSPSGGKDFLQFSAFQYNPVNSKFFKKLFSKFFNKFTEIAKYFKCFLLFLKPIILLLQYNFNVNFFFSVKSHDIQEKYHVLSSVCIHPGAHYFAGHKTGLNVCYNESYQNNFGLFLGNLFVVVFVSYFGSKLHRPKIIGLGCLIMGTGSILTALPHFFMG